MIYLGGRPLATVRPAERARQLAYVAQQPATPDALLVREVVALGRIPHVPLLGIESRADRQAIERAMARAGIAEFGARPLGHLSGGERQRVSIARALAQEPRVVLLDEPTANLDLRYQASVLALVRRLASEEGLSAVVVLHDLSLAALFCDRLLLLSDGWVVKQGDAASVLAEELLSDTYATPLRVLAHPENGAPLVTHSLSGGAV
jgi:iron complex transport system ATP-binding protein